MRVSYEQGMDANVVDALRNVGHVMFEGANDAGFASMTAIGRENNRFVPVYDSRRIGSSAVY